MKFFLTEVEEAIELDSKGERKRIRGNGDWEGLKKTKKKLVCKESEIRTLK